MAIVTANAAVQSLINGQTRSFVVIADASSVATLLAASGTATIKRLAKKVKLQVGGACTIEIKRTTGTVKQLAYKRFAAAGEWELEDLLSNANEVLQIEASASVTVDGYVDFLEGTDPT